MGVNCCSDNAENSESMMAAKKQKEEMNRVAFNQIKRNYIAENKNHQQFHQFNGEFLDIQNAKFNDYEVLATINRLGGFNWEMT